MKIFRNKILKTEIPKKELKTIFKLFLTCYIALVLISIGTLFATTDINNKSLQQSEKKVAHRKSTVSFERPQLPEILPTSTPAPIPTSTITEEENRAETNEVWGEAQQIDEVTWTIKVGEDEKMGTAGEIHKALNDYRRRHGAHPLTWDTKLAEYAQSRADHFTSISSTDKHEGFNSFLDSGDGFNQLGFNSLGENSSYGYHVEAVHLIEWVYAGDEPHDNNQLNSKWTHVGVGVNGTATNLIFGGNKQ